MKKMFYVYILTNKTHTVLYTGVTNDIKRRLYEHRNGLMDGFTKRYHVCQLVYYEEYFDIINAILREKEIKNLLRRKKEELIDGFNPKWNDLYDNL